ncbi:hypothetical protein GOSPT_024_00090 [Gordonia sputi NBRC 100414]|uniref:Uncharacterized protein n=1 Tax=Gordonia sputi NBRC 100414 TaxID=1089453 RepID=H5TWV0_9ACTN|nr:hypothetical protein GOSPT_024_00090 [Gordonia sputi NBRC 100414]
MRRLQYLGGPGLGLSDSGLAGLHLAHASYQGRVDVDDQWSDSCFDRGADPPIGIAGQRHTLD